MKIADTLVKAVNDVSFIILYFIEVSILFQAGNKILVRHPLVESKRAYVTPHKVELLHQQYWGPNGLTKDFPSLQNLK